MEVVGREVRAEIGAVAEDRAVLHQPITQKDFLAGHDVRPREENLSARIDDLSRDGRLIRIGPVGEHAENQKAAQHHDHNCLNPALCDEQTASDRLAHDALRVSEEAAGPVIRR